MKKYCIVSLMLIFNTVSLGSQSNPLFKLASRSFSSAQHWTATAKALHKLSYYCHPILAKKSVSFHKEDHTLCTEEEAIRKRVSWMGFYCKSHRAMCSDYYKKNSANTWVFQKRHQEGYKHVPNCNWPWEK